MKNYDLGNKVNFTIRPFVQSYKYVTVFSVIFMELVLSSYSAPFQLRAILGSKPYFWSSDKEYVSPTFAFMLNSLPSHLNSMERSKLLGGHSMAAFFDKSRLVRWLLPHFRNSSLLLLLRSSSLSRLLLQSRFSRFLFFLKSSFSIWL